MFINAFVNSYDSTKEEAAAHLNDKSGKHGLKNIRYDSQ